MMSNIIEELFYGNLEPQELTTEITQILKNKEDTWCFLLAAIDRNWVYSIQTFHIIVNIHNTGEYSLFFLLFLIV